MNLETLNWDVLPWERVRDGVERKVFAGTGASLSLARLSPGTEPKPHAHPNEQIVYILDGDIDYHVGDTVTHLSTGGLLTIPANERHWFVVTGDTPVLNLDIFTPAR